MLDRMRPGASPMTHEIHSDAESDVRFFAREARSSRWTTGAHRSVEFCRRPVAGRMKMRCARNTP